MGDGIFGLSWTDAAGLVGVVLYIGSYFALQAGWVRGQGYLYAFLNATAAACVLLSLFGHFNLSATIIQVTYIAISLFGIVRFYLLTRRIAFTEEELMVLAMIGPNLSKLQSRRLLDLGSWSIADPGTVLTEQGQPNTHLWFLRYGAAEVSVGGHPVAALGDVSLIGEIACLKRTPASATVTLTKPSRLFAIEAERLNAFMARNEAVRHELEGRFAAQIGEKLIRANTVLAARDAAE